MTIIAYTYSGPTKLGDNDNLIQQYPTNSPAWLPNSAVTDSYFTENFYYKKYNTNQAMIHNVTNIGVISPVDYNQNPDNKEFWFRYLWKEVNSGWDWNSGGFTLATFYNYNGTRLKKVASLFVDGTNYRLQLSYYTTAEGADTVSSTKTITASRLGDIIGYDSSAKNLIADVRILLDPMAGYVQLYGTTGTKITEYLGQTIENSALTVTHIMVNLDQGVNSGPVDAAPIFAIAADEPTFNMYVTPMTVKAEGTLQDQVAGSYTNLTTRKSNPSVSSSVTLTAPLGEEKKYSCVLNNMTDIALPANYAVKSFKLSTVVTGESSKQDNIPINLLLKKPSTSTIEQKPSGTVVPNQYTEPSGLYQVKEAVFNNNPFTAQPWQPADFADLEVGISFTGN